MKKRYKDLDVSVTLFENEDVVTTSGTGGTGPSGLEGYKNGTFSDNEKNWSSLIN